MYYSVTETMALTNLTGDAKDKSFKELSCSTELSGGIRNQLILLLALDSFLSMTAFLGNTLILFALHKVSSLRPPSKLLFRNLATTDLCVGLIVGPLAVIYFISVLGERWSICRYAFGVFQTATYILCGVSLFTVIAISVDRLLALLLGLRYRQAVTLKRMYLAVTLFWVVSILASITSLFSDLFNLWYDYTVLGLCLVTSMISYRKIFLTLRHNQVVPQSQGQSSQEITLNLARYRKTVSNALWVQLTLLYCYLPHGIIEILLLQRRLTPSIFVARSFATTLVYLNSSLNPIIYCWKMRQVRQAVKATVRKLVCQSG